MTTDELKGINEWVSGKKVPLAYAIIIEYLYIAAETGDIEDLMSAHRELNRLIDSKV